MIEAAAKVIDDGTIETDGFEFIEYTAPDPEARRRELEDEIAAAQSVFPRAEDFGVHDLIDPRETRPRLCQWLEEIQPELALHTGPRTYTVRP